MKKVKYALVQSGGGFKGTFQLGALNFINDNWKVITGLETPMRFDLNTGVSVGALNGVMVAMNKLDELNDLWLNKVANKGVSEIYTSEFIDTDSQSDKLKLKIDVKALVKKLLPEFKFKLQFFEKLGALFSRKKRNTIINEIVERIETEFKLSASTIESIADNLPLRRKLEKLIDRSLIQGVFKCGFVSLNSGKYHSVKHSDFVSNQELVNGIIASTSIPAVWQPVESVKFLQNEKFIDSKYNVDGGLMNLSPLGDAIRTINNDPEDCVWRIIVINTHSGLSKPKDFSNKSIFEVATRSVYELTMGEIFNNDINHFTELNGIIEEAKDWDPEIVLHNRSNKVIKNFEAVIINPAPNFDLGNPLVSSKELINKRYDHGYHVASNTTFFNLQND